MQGVNLCFLACFFKIDKQILVLEKQWKLEGLSSNRLENQQYEAVDLTPL